MLKDVKFPMGSDPTREVSRMFGVNDEETGLDLRGTFLINPEGKIMNSEANFYNLGRSVGEILRKLRANIHLAENPAEACPATWSKKGDKTLTPSEKMVGKVAEAMGEK